jgi:hypothetical protein
MRPPLPGPTPPAPLPPLPHWAAAGPAQTPEAAAFRSGALLAHLAVVAAAADLPAALWRDRLALAAAVAAARAAGRPEGPGALRDALHLTRAGDDPGPAGRILRQWSRAAARPVSAAHLGRVLEEVAPDRIAPWLEAARLDAAGPTPVDRAAGVIGAVLADHPRAGTAALILADAALARGLGWTHMLPLLALGLGPRDLRRRGCDLRLACHRAVAGGVRQAVPLAGDLTRAALRLRAVVPVLRARAAAQAVDLVLSRDALAPGALGTLMSDRAARRFCDRLVALGALRELSGRDTFRLYGL